MTTSRIVFEADTRPLRTAKVDLANMKKSAMAAGAAFVGMEKQTGKSSKRAAGSIKVLAGAAASLGALVGAASWLSGGISQAREFGTAIREAGTLVGGSVEQMNTMATASKALAAEFGVDKVTQAKAFYQAISAGAGSAAQATSLLKTANLLAVGGVTDTLTAVDGLTSSVNAFADYSLQASDAADAMFTAVEKGKTTIPELSAQIGNIAPLAAAAGVGFDDMLAGIAALTTTGQTTSVAVTGLKQVLSGVIKPSSEAAKTANKLGLEFSAAALKTKGLNGFLQDVIQKTGGSNAQMSKLFGSVEALNAVLAFSGAAGDKFNETLDAMAEKTGAASRAFDVMSQDKGQRLNVVLQRLSNIQQSVGDAALTVLVPSMEAAANALEALGNNMDVVAGVSAAALTISLIRIAPLALSAAAGLTTMAFAAGTSLVSGIAAATASLTAFKAALITTGIGAIVVAIGTLVGAFITLSVRVGGFKNAVNLILDKTTQAWERIKAKTYSMGFAVISMWENIRASALESLAGVVESIAPFSNKMIGAFVGVHTAVFTAFSTLPDILKRFGGIAVNSLVGIVENGINGLLAPINRILDRFNLATIKGPDLSRFKAEIAPATDLVGKVGKSFSDAFNKDYLGPISNGLSDLASSARDSADESANLSELFSAISSLPADAGGKIKGVAENLAEVSENAGDVEDQILKTSPVVVDLGTSFETAGDKAVAATNKIKDAAKKMREGVQSSFNDLFGALGKGNISGGFSSFFSDIGKQGNSAFSSLLKGAIKPGGGGFSSIFSGLTQSVKGGFGALSGAFSGGLSTAVSGITSAVTSFLPAIGAISGVVNLIKGFSSKTVIGGGLKLGFEDGQATGSTFKRIKSTKFWGLSSKKYDRNSAFDDEFAQSLNDQAAAVRDGVSGLYDSLGVSIGDDFINSIDLAVKRINTKGLSQQEIQEKINEVFANYGDALSDAVGGISLEAATLLASVQSGLDLLGNPLEIASVTINGLSQSIAGLSEASDAAAALVEVAGGFDELSGKTSAFYDAFYTDQEKLDNLQQSVEATFQKLGLAVPETNAGFKDLVLAQDLMTEAGREAYNSLLSVAPEFHEVASAAEATAKAIRGEYDLSNSTAATAFEAKFQRELQNAGAFDQDTITQQNAEAAQQTALLQSVVELLKKQVRVNSQSQVLASIA